MIITPIDSIKKYLIQQGSNVAFSIEQGNSEAEGPDPQPDFNMCRAAGA